MIVKAWFLGWRNKYEQGTIPDFKAEMDTQLNIMPELDILNILVENWKEIIFKKYY